MNNKVRYYINKEKGVIHRQFNGDIFTDDIIKSWLDLMNNFDLSEMNGVVNDFNDANICFKPHELNIILSFLKKNKHIFYQIKLAVVSNNPSNIVFPTLAKEKDPKLKIMPFSSCDSAEFWIMHDREF